MTRIASAINVPGRASRSQLEMKYGRAHRVSDTVWGSPNLRVREKEAMPRNLCTRPHAIPRLFVNREIDSGRWSSCNDRIQRRLRHSSPLVRQLGPGPSCRASWGTPSSPKRRRPTVVSAELLLGDSWSTSSFVSAGPSRRSGISLNSASVDAGDTTLQTLVSSLQILPSWSGTKRR